MRGFILVGCLVLLACFAFIGLAFFESLRWQQKLLQAEVSADENRFQLMRQVEEISKTTLGPSNACQYPAEKIPEIFEALRASPTEGCMRREGEMEIRYVMVMPTEAEPMITLVLARANAHTAWQQYEVIQGELMPF